MPSDKVIIYCDGACSGNQFEKNVGGWGAVLKYKDRVKKIYGGEKNTTNNRMELTACIKALEEIKKKDAEIEIYCDSAYIVNCIQQRWYVKWQKNGWKTAKKEPVENQDLWMRLLELLGHHKVNFNKVKGHAGVELNELADQLANRGMAGAEKKSDNVDKPSSAKIFERPSREYSDSRLKFRAVEGGYLLRLQRGARVMETLKTFIKTKEIGGGTVSAIGAVEDVELRYFSLSDKKYQSEHFPEIYELISFQGNISYVEGEPFVHAHAVLSNPKYQSFAGHFFEGTVAVTMEVYIRVFGEKIIRSPDEETGLNLLDL